MFCLANRRILIAYSLWKFVYFKFGMRKIAIQLDSNTLFTHDFLNQLLADLKIKSVYSHLCERCVSDFTPVQTG